MKKLSLPALTCVIFFTVSGGPFGLESLVGDVGTAWRIETPDSPIVADRDDG